MKRWSIIERSLILEAYIGLAMFFVDRIGDVIKGHESMRLKIQSLLDAQSTISAAQNESAVSGGRIDETMIDVKELFTHTSILNESLSSGKSVPAKLIYRRADLNFFSMR